MKRRNDERPDFPVGTTTGARSIAPNIRPTLRPRELMPSPPPGFIPPAYTQAPPNTATGASLPNANGAEQRQIPGFVSKLYRMVNEGSSLIRWGAEGTTFTVLRPEEFSRAVLPLYFKHNNFSSFVRQLNMYGFHKVPQVGTGEETTGWEFTHPSFVRGRPDLLMNVRRKTVSATRDDENNSGSSLMPTGDAATFQGIVQELSALRAQQTALRTDLQAIQRDSQLLWSETLATRERHAQQQVIIDKILGFLASVFSHDKSLGEAAGLNNLTPRKRPLMIEELPAADILFDSTEASPRTRTMKPPGTASQQERIIDALRTATDIQDDLNFLVDNLDPEALDPAERTEAPLDVDWDAYSNLYSPTAVNDDDDVVG